jgi:DNA-binding response OmpR family regulator
MKNDKKRILVVDDDTTITRLLKLNLEQTDDYDVQVENASTAAVVAARRFQPHLILLDVMMPGLDGGDLAQSFRSSPQLKDVPIVFFTAAAKKEEVASRSGRIGGLPFLAKPADVSQVIACINQNLR